MQSLNQSLIAVAGTTEGGARAMQFLKETGDELGYTTLDLAKGYKLLAASSKETILEGEPQKLYLSLLLVRLGH